MQETPEVKIEDENEDLIPKDQLPENPNANLDEESEEAVEPKDEEEEVETEVKPSPDSSSEKVEKKPKPVEGETPREAALRFKVQNLQKRLRKEGIEEISKTIPTNQTQTLDYQELKDEGYTDTEIAKMTKAIDVIAAKSGYVKAKSYQEVVNGTLADYTKVHPEYLPENDPDDVRWEKFESIVRSGIYNLSGKTPEQLTAIFNRIDADVKAEMGETTEDTKSKDNKRAAEFHKVQVSSHTGGTKGNQAKPKLDLNQPIGGIRFKGFTEDDFS